jgi:hypothetical protein
MCKNSCYQVGSVAGPSMQPMAGEDWSGKHMCLGGESGKHMCLGDESGKHMCLGSESAILQLQRVNSMQSA